MAVSITLSGGLFHVAVEPSTRERSPGLRGDIDNYEKAVLDGLNGVAFVDDSQVVDWRAVFN